MITRNRHNILRKGDDITVLQGPNQRKHTFRHCIVARAPYKLSVLPEHYSSEVFKKYCAIHNKNAKKVKKLEMTFVTIFDPKKRQFPWDHIPIEWTAKGKGFFRQYPNYKARAKIQAWKRKCERVNGIIVLNQVLNQDGGLVRFICEYI